MEHQEWLEQAEFCLKRPRRRSGLSSSSSSSAAWPLAGTVRKPECAPLRGLWRSMAPHGVKTRFQAIAAENSDYHFTPWKASGGNGAGILRRPYPLMGASARDRFGAHGKPFSIMPRPMLRASRYRRSCYCGGQLLSGDYHAPRLGVFTWMLIQMKVPHVAHHPPTNDRLGQRR
jgi:hypothetical protein